MAPLGVKGLKDLCKNISDNLQFFGDLVTRYMEYYRYAKLLLLSQRYVSAKLEVSIRLSDFHKIGSTGQTDGQVDLMRSFRVSRIITSIRQNLFAT